MKILLIGYGKMNEAIYELYKHDVIGVINVRKKYLKGKPDIIIDFSHPNMLDETLFYSKQYGVPVLIGTTGYNEEKMAQIKELSDHVPVIMSSNFSLGIYLIRKMIEDNISNIKGYEKKIIELHHKNKLDSISGTALMFSKLLNTTDIEVKRFGNSFGEHKILLSNELEKITISHKALNRMSFIEGVKISMNWLINQEKGLYSFGDVLNE